MMKLDALTFLDPRPASHLPAVCFPLVVIHLCLAFDLCKSRKGIYVETEASLIKGKEKKKQLKSYIALGFAFLLWIFFKGFSLCSFKPAAPLPSHSTTQLLIKEKKRKRKLGVGINSAGNYFYAVKWSNR